MASNRLILRVVNSPWILPITDITKGSVLTHVDLDNNLIYLRGESIYSASSTSDEVILHKINGQKIRFNNSSSVQNNISKTIYITSTELDGCTSCVGPTLEDKIAQYVTLLGIIKQPTDSDIWIEFEDNDGIFTSEFNQQFD